MPRRSYHQDEMQVRLAAGITAYSLGIPAEAILNGDDRAHSTARARQVAMYLSHVVLGMSLARIATAMGRDRSTVAYSCHRIEDFRDSPDVDHWLEDLEKRLRGAALPACSDGRTSPPPIERLQLI